MKCFTALLFVAGLAAAQSSSSSSSSSASGSGSAAAAGGSMPTFTVIAEGGGSPRSSGMASGSGSAAAAAATGISTNNAMVVMGQGKDLAGDSCGCQCLCGMTPPPSNVAVNNFGGFPGVMSAM